MKTGFGNVRAGRCIQRCSICNQHSLCEHNLRDASIAPMNVCSGIGGDCNNGEKFVCTSEYCQSMVSRRGEKEE